ncbi:MAG: hypothetical protein WAV55_11270 [Clostridiaceae bacterium]
MKLRKNRLVFLAMLGGAAYLVNKEIQKNPELVEDAKQQWSTVKDEVGKKLRETKDHADDLISEVERKVGPVVDDAWETVDDLGEDLTEHSKDLEL